MPNEREFLSELSVRDYDIAGNQLRAYYDKDNKLIFVIDFLIDGKKPNVLLVIEPDNNRKWDDVLENDYGIDLETVRPKKDNKYQKLDIEYSGLDIYRALFDAYETDNDVEAALGVLGQFRGIAVRRSATDRLLAAEELADNARDTIDKTNDTIDELNVRMRQLRAKLSELRKNIGKEPTKQSAAKILRTESQIDAITDKLQRARKRLDNAKKRLASATDDAEFARDILSRFEDVSDAVVPAIVPEAPVAKVPDNNLTLVEDAPLPTEYIESDDLIITTNPKAEEMADEEVKPLFDTDPEILDEEIAFKPIDFSMPSAISGNEVAVKSSVPDVYDDAVDVAPLAFTPPVSFVSEQEDVVLPSQAAPAPVLDSITSVESPVGESIVEQETVVAPAPVVPSYMAPAAEPMPEPDVAPAPIDSGFRPVSPITGDSVSVNSGKNARKPAVMYYVLLIALIVMSIFVLWLYQKSTGNTAVPNIGGKVEPQIIEEQNIVPEEPKVTEVVKESITVAEPVLQVVEPEPTPEPEVVVPVVESIEPVVESMPEPTVVAAETVTVEPTEIVVPVSAPVVKTVAPAPEKEPVKIETEEEILAKKPAYGVSQNEAMFVADDEFETDRLSATVPAKEIVAVDMFDTPIVRAEEAEYYQEPEYIEEEIPGCENGEPDRFGCCPGETYTQIDNGGFVCCPDAGGDCFPPLF